MVVVVVVVVVENPRSTVFLDVNYQVRNDQMTHHGNLNTTEVRS